MLLRAGSCAPRYRSSRLIYARGRYGHHGDIRSPVSKTTHPEPGATIMTTLAHTKTTGVNAKHVTTGSVCKVVAVAAIVSTISVFSADRLSHANFTAADLTQQTELRDLLCRIDRRCTHQTE